MYRRVIMLWMMFMLLGSNFPETTPLAATKAYKAKTKSVVTVYKKASKKAGTLGKIKKNSKVTVTNHSKSWVKLTYKKRTGYVLKKQIKATPKPYKAKTSHKLVLRKNAKKTSKNLASIKKNTVLTVTPHNSKWLKVTYKKKTGYILKKYAKKYAASYKATTTSKVILRKNAKTASKNLASIKKNTVLTVTPHSSKWLKVTYKKKTGYILKKHTKKYTTTPKSVKKDPLPKFSSTKPKVGSQLDPWKQVIRTTKLPRNASQWPYILADVPNHVYETPYKFRPTISGKNVYNGAYVEDSHFYWHLFRNTHAYQNKVVKNANSFYNLILNVDYRTIDYKWAKKAAAFTYNDSEWMLRRYVDWVKENKIITQGNYKAEPSMIYYSPHNLHVRAQFNFVIKSYKQYKGIFYPNLTACFERGEEHDYQFSPMTKFNLNQWYTGVTDTTISNGYGKVNTAGLLYSEGEDSKIFYQNNTIKKK